MKLLRLPKLRRRDEEESVEKVSPKHGVKSDDEHDLVADVEVDRDLANHMSLPGTTTFWDTTLCFCRLDGWNSRPCIPDDEPTHTEDESGSLEMTKPRGPCDADVDKNAEIKLTGEMYPRYSLDKLIKSHKLAEFPSSCTSVEEGRSSLAIFLQRYGLVKEPQETVAQGQKSQKRMGRMLRLARSPLWGKGTVKLTRELTADTSSALLIDSPPKAERQKLQRFRFGQLRSLTSQQ